MMNDVAIINNKWVKGLSGLASYLHVSRGTVWNWKKQGLIKPVRRIKNTIYFDVENDNFIVDKTKIIITRSSA